MSIKVEIGVVLATALMGMGVFQTTKPLEPVQTPERASAFSAADYAAFDRDITVKGEPCEVGLNRGALCFTSSPLQGRIVEGEPVPASIPLLAAEFPILVALPMKSETQKLLRYGTVLALIDSETRIVEDMLHIDAGTFADASSTGQTELVETQAPSAAG